MFPILALAETMIPLPQIIGFSLNNQYSYLLSLALVASISQYEENSQVSDS